MGYYINPELGYYEGDAIPGDVPVPQRPDATYTWDGSAWQSTAETRNAPFKAQIGDLEALITQRRLREAALGIDNGWLANLNNQIATIRLNIEAPSDSSTQLAALTTTQLSSITTTALAAITTTQLAGFTTTQLAALR